MAPRMTRREFLAVTGGAAALAPLMDGPAFAALTGPLRLFTVAVAGRDQEINEARKDLGIDIKVTFNVAHTETFAKLNAGVLSPQQDLLHIQQPFVRPLAQRKWIQPIDPAQLKNHGRMLEQFKNPEWAQLDGKLYAVPYFWGYDSIVYNAKHMPDGGETWGRLWDDRYKGRLSLRDDALSSFQPVALFLGYNPNRMTKAQLDALEKALDQYRLDVGRYPDNELGLKDTVRVNPKEVVDIVVRFQVFCGRYMYHCHILEHEDHDMMRPFVVMPAELMPFMDMHMGGGHMAHMKHEA